MRRNVRTGSDPQQTQFGRWDRYCGIRQTGKASYVKTRNVPRSDVLSDGLLPSKAPYVSSLNSTLAMNGPRTAPKVCEVSH